MTRTATNSWGSERQVFSQVWWSLAVPAASEAKVKGPLELPSPGPAWAEDFISNTEKNEVFLTKTRHILTKKTLNGYCTYCRVPCTLGLPSFL